MNKKGRASIFFLAFAKDLLFIGPFFIISFFALRGTVPSHEPVWINFWAAMVGLSMTCIAWLAFQMFKVVLIDQLAQNRARETHK